jgi:hypothetical protein
MFILLFFVLSIYKSNSLDKYSKYEDRILVKRNKNNFDIEYTDINTFDSFDFNKMFTLNSIGCIDGEEYRTCTDESGTSFYPIRILPANLY